jgi:outer membrane lipoprotein-sorting protein
MMNRLTQGLPIGLLALSLMAAPSVAETPQEKGRSIAEETEKRDQGWGDSQVRLTMTLKNAHGDRSVRELRIRSLEMNEPGLGDRSVTVFYKPRDIEGTAFLSHTKILDPDNQWIFLPSLKRVKRISSRNKSGPFVGSEFAYEDLVSQEVERYTYKWLRDEPCGELTCHVTERYPVYEHSGYTKQVVWTDTTDFQPRRVEFYDRKGALLKTLLFQDYRQYLGQYWRSHIFDMVNAQTGKSTILEFTDFEFKVGLAEKDFRKDRLKRAR